MRRHPLAPRFAPVTSLIAVFILGTAGFSVATAGRHSLLDCMYMTAISLTTVGYGHHLGMGDSVGGRIYTMSLFIVGMGVTLYAVSAVTAFILEGHLKKLLWERRMKEAASTLCAVQES